MTAQRATEVVRGWFAGRLPNDWFVGVPEVRVDREEITVVGALAPPDLDEAVSDAERAAAASGRIKGFREQTRSQRMRIADEAALEFGRTVSWGASCGERRELFTNLSVPVMTRLRQRDRVVLDTLVDAGVARSRSDALAWCVRLVGQHSAEWLADLRTAMSSVEQVREAGPHTAAGS